MTERSWLWDSTATGDATLAPYTRLRFNRWFGGPYSNSDNTKVHVIPGYLDNLFARVLAGTLNILTIKAGAAIVGDYLYINTAPVYLTIPSNVSSTTRRTDIIALRIDNTPNTPTERTIRVVHLKGYETAYTDPVLLPTLTRDSNGYWEVEIARVFVNSDNYTLEQKHISSQVSYVPTIPHSIYQENLIVNPEFLVPDYDSGTLEYLGSWIFTPAGAATIAPAAGIDAATRTRCASIVNADVNDKLSQNVPFKRVGKSGKHYFILDGLVQPQQNNGKIIIRVNALSNDQLAYYTELTREIGIFGEPSITTQRVLEIVDFDDADADNPLISLNIEILNVGAAGDDFKVGPIQFARGFFSGGLRSQHQIVFYEKQSTDASWSFTAKSSGTTTIDVTVSFGAEAPIYLKGLILRIGCNDSGSAASANCGLDIHRYDGVAGIKHGGVELSGETNDRVRRAQIIVPVLDYWKNGNITNVRFQAVVRATGAATLDADIDIVGYIL